MHMDLLGDQVTMAGVIVWAVQRLKTATWFPWLREGGGAANALLAGLLAAATTAGLEWNYSASVGTLTITGLTAGGIVHFAGEIIRQLVLQQSMWVGLKIKNGTTK